jgi:hypothetical protein
MSDTDQDAPSWSESEIVRAILSLPRDRKLFTAPPPTQDETRLMKALGIDLEP